MAQESKNILITGGCGFMGSHFVRYIYDNYPAYNLFNMDALTYAGNQENLNDIQERDNEAKDNARYHFLKGDVCDTIFLKNLFHKLSFDCVIHFAAETHVDRSIFNVGDFTKTNMEGTRILLEMIRANPKTRFVYISTDEVYGDVSRGESLEDSQMRPSNPYAASKAGADLLVQAYGKTYNLPVVTVRSSNNYGTHQYPEKLIPLTISNLIEDQKIPLHGRGEHIRSWLHVNDFCRAVDIIMHSGQEKETYNISGEQKTNQEIIAIIANKLNKNPQKYISYVNDRPSADLRYAPNSTKLQQELGWSRLCKIEGSIEDTIAWYVANKAWWKRIKKTKEFLSHYEKQSKALWY